MSDSQNGIKLFLDELIDLCSKHDMVPSNNSNYSAYVKEHNPVEYWNIFNRYRFDATKIKQILAIIEVEKIGYELSKIYHRCPMCESKNGCDDECPAHIKWEAEENDIQKKS